MRKSEKYIARFANVAYEEKEIQKIEKKAKLIEIIRSPQYAKRYVNMIVNDSQVDMKIGSLIHFHS